LHKGIPFFCGHSVWLRSLVLMCGLFCDACFAVGALRAGECRCADAWFVLRLRFAVHFLRCAG
jgi:hypothetical protein